MKIFTAENIRSIDRYTIEEEGVSSMELIHRAAMGVAGEILSNFPPSKPTIIFAGSGNNGADALIVGKILIENGFRPHILLFNFNGNSLSRDCAAAKRELLSLPDVHLTEIIDRANIPCIEAHHLVIDGMFGTGLNNPLAGGFTTLVQNISDSGATIISIDVPSGMFSDWNHSVRSRNVIHATTTLAIQFPRIAFFLADNAPLVGDWKVINIDLSQKAIDDTPTKYYYVEREEVACILRPRKPFSSKADYGQALLIAGCYGMMGAAVMAARGAIRAGVGKLTVHSPRCGFEIVQSQVPEALFSPDQHEHVISDMIPRFSNYDAIGVGPGIGGNDATRGALDSLIKNWKKPMVLDADALNIIARNLPLLDHIPPLSILTPHAGEFDRLFGAQSSAEARLLKAIEVAKKHHIIIVLKGHYTATVRPDGRVFFNSSGTPALATAGSGDVLTGIITGLLAQKYKPEVAAVVGVYIHGVAGQIAAETQGEYGTSGLDIAAAVGPAIKSIVNS